jgi:shikimate dehydrogenase
VTEGITSATRLLALLGDPVAHSRSPVLHNAAMQALALDGVYVALRCRAEHCAALLHGIARADGAGNVTIPHKVVAAATLERATEVVNQTGACNTFWLEKGRVCGDNTDVEGFVRAMQIAAGGISGAQVLLLGAGGAARSISAGLAQLGAAHIDVLARSPGRVEDLQRIVHGTGTSVRPVSSPTRAFDVVINATPLGLHDHDPLPFPVEALSGTAIVFDAVYMDGGTRWVQAARRAGLRAIDGEEMLVQQAAAAFRRWWGQDPPLHVMRRALTQTDAR